MFRDAPIRGLHCLLSAFLFFSIENAYTQIDSVIYSYSGSFQNYPPLFLDRILACILCCLPSVWLPMSLKRPSDLIISIFHATVLLPTAAISIHFFQAGQKETLLVPLVCLVGLTVMDGFRRVFRVRLPDPGALSGPARFGLLGLTLLCAAYIFSLSGGKIDLSFADIYARRAEAHEATAAAGGLSRYVTASLSGVFAPLCLCVGLAWRKPLFIGVALLGVVSLFSFEGSRSTVFLVIVILSVFAARRWFDRRIFEVFFVCFIGAFCLGYQFTANLATSKEIYLPYAMIFQRNVNLKGIITCAHFEYTLENGPGYFGEPSSTLGSLIGQKSWYPFNSFVIGELYFHDPTSSANGNVMAASFAQAGYLYMLFSCLAVSVLCGILDSLKTERRVLESEGALWGHIWSNGALETSLLTNGLGLGLVMLWLLGKPSPKKGLPEDEVKPLC